MKKIVLSKPVQMALRLAVGGAFIVAGVIKLQDPWAFAMVIDGYGLTPGWADLPLAYGLPILEVVSGAGLIFNIRWALELVAAQLLLFVGVLAYGMYLGLDVDCGCFGPGDPEGQAYSGMGDSMVRDLIMLAALAAVYWRRKAMQEPPRSMAVILKPFGGVRR